MVAAPLRERAQRIAGAYRSSLPVERVDPEQSPLARDLGVQREAELRHHVARCGVRLRRDRDDALESELSERPGHHRAAGLGRDPAAPPGRVERPADLGIVAATCGGTAARRGRSAHRSRATRPPAGRSRARPSGAASGRRPRRSARASARRRGTA